jgi:hypothetical protein
VLCWQCREWSLSRLTSKQTFFCLLTVVVVVHRCLLWENRYSEATSFIEGLSEATTSLTDYLSSMIWPVCEFRPNMTQLVRRQLNLAIKGQSEGIDIILNAIAAWEFQRELGTQEPLVLSITGPTGTRNPPLHLSCLCLPEVFLSVCFAVGWLLEQE